MMYGKKITTNSGTKGYILECVNVGPEGYICRMGDGSNKVLKLEEFTFDEASDVSIGR